VRSPGCNGGNGVVGIKLLHDRQFLSGTSEAAAQVAGRQQT
jgi:hypothetical protein